MSQITAPSPFTTTETFPHGPLLPIPPIPLLLALRGFRYSPPNPTCGTRAPSSPPDLTPTATSISHEKWILTILPEVEGNLGMKNKNSLLRSAAARALSGATGLTTPYPPSLTHSLTHTPTPLLSSRTPLTQTHFFFTFSSFIHLGDHSSSAIIICFPFTDFFFSKTLAFLLSSSSSSSTLLFFLPLPLPFLAV